MMTVVTVGLDLAKNLFRVHGVDADGRIGVRRKLRRAEVLCGFGHDIHKILRHLRVFLCHVNWLLALFRRFTRGTGRHQAMLFSA
jgi:hypothetical protein